MKRCDVGGNYFWPMVDGPAVYEPPCEATATHRYRSPGMVEGHWQYRCAQHVGWLDRNVCTVEPLSREVAE